MLSKSCAFLTHRIDERFRQWCFINGAPFLRRWREDLQDYPNKALPPRASNTSPKSVWLEPTRQKCEVISMSWPRCE